MGKVKWFNANEMMKGRLRLSRYKACLRLKKAS